MIRFAYIHAKFDMVILVNSCSGSLLGLKVASAGIFTLNDTSYKQFSCQTTADIKKKSYSWGTKYGWKKIYSFYIFKQKHSKSKLYKEKFSFFEIFYISYDKRFLIHCKENKNTFSSLRVHNWKKKLKQHCCMTCLGYKETSKAIKIKV